MIFVLSNYFWDLKAKLSQVFPCVAHYEQSFYAKSCGAGCGLSAPFQIQLGLKCSKSKRQPARRRRTAGRQL